MNQNAAEPTESETDHPLSSVAMTFRGEGALTRRRGRGWNVARRGVVTGLGIAKDAYDELMACVGSAVECGDDLARSAIRFRRKLARRFASVSASSAAGPAISRGVQA